MRKKIVAFAFLLSLAGVQPAAAQVVSLNFEGIAPYPNSNDVFVQNFYNGGTASNGTSGTNYGVAFSSNALAVCLNTIGTACSNASRGGQGDPASALGALFFLTGSQTYLNYAAGFTTGFSFNYSAVNAGSNGSVGVYDGLNGTGNLLATISLGLTNSSCASGYAANFCPFSPVGVSFAGTARSIGFGGVANQIAFDDITFGSTVPGMTAAVPEASAWATMMIGLGWAGGLMRRRRAVATRLRFA